MDDSSLLLFACLGALICGALGYAVGANEKNGALGGLMGFLLGPLGIVVIAAINVSSSKRRKEAEQAEMQRYMMAKAATPAAPLAPVKIRVRRNGQVLGNFFVSEVQEKLEAGELKWEDEFFDVESKGWVQLAGHPEV